MKRKTRLRFQTKLYLSYTVILLVFTLSSLGYWYNRIHSERQNSIRDNISLMAVQTSQALDDFLYRINDIFYLHNTNQTVRNGLLSSDRELYQYMTFLSETALPSLDRKVIEVAFYDNYGQRYPQDSEHVLPLNNESLYMADAGKNNGTLCVNAVCDNIPGSVFSRILPISKELIDIQTGRSIGYIIAYIDFWRLCESIGPQLNSSCGTIICDDSQLLYVSHEKYDFLRETLEGRLPERETFTAQLRSSSDSYMIYGLYNKYFDWTIIKVLPLHSIYFDIFPFSLPFLGLTLLTLVVLLLVSYFLSRSFSQGISSLHNALARTTNNHLERIPEKNLSNDEIGELGMMFNSMMDKLNKSIKREYIAKINARDMQLSMLSYQINPHFLNNCLNTISSMAILHGVPEIAGISQNLGKLFQYNLQGDNFVTIKEEFENTKNYCHLQHARFPDRFQIDFHVEPRLGAALCLKFLLQPVVENCFSHGFKTINRPGQKQTIDIQVTALDQTIVMTVVDNGRGIASEKLDTLRRRLADMDSTSPPRASIGLWNVNQRIKAYFGSDYGVTIDSVQDSWTSVQLKLPLLIVGDTVSQN